MPTRVVSDLKTGKILSIEYIPSPDDLTWEQVQEVLVKAILNYIRKKNIIINRVDGH